MGNTVTRSHIRDVDPGVGKATRANTKKNSTGFLHEHPLSNTSPVDSPPIPSSYPAPIHLSVSSSHNLSTIYTSNNRHQIPLFGYEANSVPSLPTNLSSHDTSADAAQTYYSPTNSSSDDHSLVSASATPQQRPHRYHSVPNHAQSRSNFPENRHSFTYGSQRSLKSLAVKAPVQSIPQPQLKSQTNPQIDTSAQKPPLPPSKLLHRTTPTSSAVPNPKRRLPSSPSPTIRRKERHHGNNISFSRNSSSQSVPSAVEPSVSSTSNDVEHASGLDPVRVHGRDSSLGARTPPFAHRSPANIDPNLPGGTVYDCQTARTQTPPRVDKPPRARKVVSFNENVHVVTYPNEGSSTHSSTAGDTSSAHYIETRQPKRRARAVLRLLSRVTAPISQADGAQFSSSMATTSNCFSASYDTCCGLRFGDDEAATEEKNSVVTATRSSIEQRANPDRVSSLSFSREDSKDAKTLPTNESRITTLEESRYSLVEGAAAMGTVDDDFDYNERAPLGDDDDTLSLSDAHPSMDGIDEPEAIGDQLLSPAKEGRSDERVSSTFDIAPLWKRLKRVDELDAVRSSRPSVLKRISSERHPRKSRSSGVKGSLILRSELSVSGELTKAISAPEQSGREYFSSPDTFAAIEDRGGPSEQQSIAEVSVDDTVSVPINVKGISSDPAPRTGKCPEAVVSAGNWVTEVDASVSSELIDKGSPSRVMHDEEQDLLSAPAPLAGFKRPTSSFPCSRPASNPEFMDKQQQTPIAGLSSSQMDQEQCNTPPSEQALKDMSDTNLTSPRKHDITKEASRVVPTRTYTINRDIPHDSTHSSSDFNAMTNHNIPSPGSNNDVDGAFGAILTNIGVTFTQASPSSHEIGSSPETAPATDPASDNDPVLGAHASKSEDGSKDEVTSKWVATRRGMLSSNDPADTKLPTHSSGDRKVAEIIEKVSIEGKADGTLQRPSRTADSLLHEACQLEERLLSGSRNNSLQLGEDPLELSGFPGNDTSEATLSEAIGSDGNLLSTVKESELPSEKGMGDLDIDAVCLSHDDYSVAACSPALSPLAGVYYGTQSPRGHGLGLPEDLPVEIDGVIDYPEYAVLHGQAIEDSVFGSEPNTPIMKATSGWDEPFKEFEIGEQFYDNSGSLRHVSYEDRLPKQSVPEVLLHDWSGSTPIEPNVEIVDSAPNSRSSDTYNQNTSPRAIEPQKDIRNTAMLLSARLNVDMAKSRSKALGERLSSPIKLDEVDGRIARDLSTAVGCADNVYTGEDGGRNNDMSVMAARRESESRRIKQQENAVARFPDVSGHTGRGSPGTNSNGLYYGAGLRLGRPDPKLRDFQRSIERKSFSEMGYRTLGLDNERDEFFGERGAEPTSNFRTFSEKTERGDLHQRHVMPLRRRRLSNMEMSEAIEDEASNPLRNVMERLVNRMNLGKKSFVQE